MAETSASAETSDEYTVRRFRDGDRKGFLSLYEAVRGEPCRPEWFAWRYEYNPYLSHIPVFVAESDDGEIVGACPLAAFQMRTPGETVLALYPSDTMIHPDHRQQGLTEWMFSACTDFYTDDEPAFYFDFSSGTALEENLELGYRVVTDVPTYYRVQNPDAVLGGDSRRERLLSQLSRRVLSGYLGLRERTATVDLDVTVGRYTEVPIDVLMTLYQRSIPDKFHAVRDATFYRWRFSDSEHPPTTYVAFRDDKPLAAIVSYVDTVDGVRRVKLADIVPMEETEGRSAAVGSILSAIVNEHAEADVIVATGSCFPSAALTDFGFLSDDAFPLSAVAETTTLTAYPLVDESIPDRWNVSNLRLDNGDDWIVTFCTRDTT